MDLRNYPNTKVSMAPSNHGTPRGKMPPGSASQNRVVRTLRKRDFDLVATNINSSPATNEISEDRVSVAFLETAQILSHAPVKGVRNHRHYPITTKT